MIGVVEEWQTFFAAQVGASAALTGLVFVALSINLQRIMQARSLIGRAAEAVILLVAPVIIGLAMLAPYDSVRTTGALTGIAALGFWVFVVVILFRGGESAGNRPGLERMARVGLAQASLVPPIVGAGIMLGGSTAGAGLVALGVVVSICAGILDAWVLLVEILR
jgi:modulator of FtsH protease